MGRERLVLRRGVGRDAVDDAVGARGLQLVNVLPESAGRPAQAIYAMPGGRGFVYHVEDARLDLAYVAAVGEGAAWLGDRLEAALAVEAAGAHLALLAGAPDAAAVRRGLGLLVVGGTGSEDEIVAELGRALGSEDAEVRFVALLAATYATSARALALVEQVASADPVPALRRAAGDVAAQVRASVGDGP
jgi:hypothetical protein